MKNNQKKAAALAALALLAAPLTVLAQGTEAARGVYAKAGFLGVGLGYAQSIDDRFGVRADFSTIGSQSKKGTWGQLRYSAKTQANQVGAYGDYFPLGNGFRLSGGLHLRSVKVDATPRPNAAGTITIHNVRVNYGPDDWARAEIKYPTLSPYLGVGWGHHARRDKGWGAVFDLGVSLRGPKTSLQLNDAFYQRLDAMARMAGSTADAEIAGQLDKIKDKADDFKILPQVYIGVSYRF